MQNWSSFLKILAVIQGLNNSIQRRLRPKKGAVRLDPNTTSFSQEGKYLLHSLCEERISPGLTDDQICPLHDHNTDKEGSVTSEFQDLALAVSLQGTMKIIH